MPARIVTMSIAGPSFPARIVLKTTEIVSFPIRHVTPATGNVPKPAGKMRMPNHLFKKTNHLLEISLVNS